MAPRPLRILSTLALATGLAGLTAAPADAAREPLIQGVAVNGNGQPVLDVAVSATDEGGQTSASDLSYENAAADGSPQRGYFALHVGSNGTYTVTLKKKGFETERISGVEIRRGGKVASLGEVSLLRSTTTGARVLHDVRVGEKAKVKVTVEPTGQKPIGKVLVKDGRKTVGWATLKGADKGVVTVTLDKLPKGSYDLRAVYGGFSAFGSSTSRKVTLTVKPARNRMQRPNALTYVA